MNPRAVSWRMSVGGVVFLVAVVFAGCGGSATSGSQVTASQMQGTAARPSASALMVCAAEGQREIATSVGVTPTRPVLGHWWAGRYSCDYAYRGAQTMTLTVAQLADAAAATAEFDRLGVRLGRGRGLQGLGQGAFQTANGSTVVRKDNLVLLVDVTHLGPQFGIPSSPRADVSLSVAATIMGCWTGA